MKLLLITLFALSSTLSANTAFAGKKKVCKEIKSQQCKKRQDCSWTKAYEKKDGTKVKGFCKAKPKKKK